MTTAFSGAPNGFYCVALSLTLREIGPGPTADLIRQALDAPSPASVREVLDAGVGQPWRVRIEHALIEVGIAASGFLECGS